MAPTDAFSAMRTVFTLFIVLVMSGCGSVQRVLESEHSEEMDHQRNSLLAQTLRNEVALWIGTPHVLGRADSSGVDCSGLVQLIYADALSVHTPRTTSQLIEEGRRVRKAHLQAGDLVFFKPGKKTDHVGIFLDRNEFAHASSSRGVMISSLDNPYWKDVYRGARRLLSEEELAQLILRIQEQRQLTEDLLPGS